MLIKKMFKIARISIMFILNLKEKKVVKRPNMDRKEFIKLQPDKEITDR